jgi:hypothetical protein
MLVMRVSVVGVPPAFLSFLIAVGVVYRSDRHQEEWVEA